MTEIVETTPAPPPADSGVCEWLSAIPMASSAGNTLYSLYEGSKGYSRASDYALGTIETSVKFAAGTVAPLVKKLDKPSKSSHTEPHSKLVFCIEFTVVFSFLVQFMQSTHLLQNN